VFEGPMLSLRGQEPVVERKDHQSNISSVKLTR
jgi:hypothetical protein